MSDRGFVIEEIVEDGACLFRSISLQIYGDQDMHEIIRNQTMDYIVSFFSCPLGFYLNSKSIQKKTTFDFSFQYQNREYFMQFVTEDIDSYVSRKRNNHVHGNHIEIQAISEIFNRPVEIYAYHTGKLRAKFCAGFCVFCHSLFHVIENFCFFALFLASQNLSTFLDWSKLKKVLSHCVCYTSADHITMQF